MKEFKVNNYITLKLENGKTVIYIDGKWFDQCKYILTRKKVYDLENIIEIESVDELADNSIDEIASNLDHSLEGIKPDLIDIPEEIRFWVHCSNLQTWVENNYDTRMIHRNLAFPLLKRLSELGDLQAKRVFKEEIAKRIESGYHNVITFLINEGYIKFLNKQDILSLNIEKIIDLESELSIPLIKEMILLGISELNKTFKKKIIKGFKQGSDSFKNYLYSEEYLNFLDENESLDIVPLESEKKVIKNIQTKLKNQFVYRAYGLDTRDSLKFNIEKKNISSLGFYEIKTNENITWEEIIESLLKLKSLKTLYLNNNQLKSLPEIIGNLESIQTLYINNNQLKQIPESIGNLKNLSYLDASNNKLCIIPESIGKLKNLSYLDFSNNKIKELSYNMKELTSLKTLILENNNLTSIPEFIGDIKTLKYLKISGNNIISFPKSIIKKIH